MRNILDAVLSLPLALSLFGVPAHAQDPASSPPASIYFEPVTLASNAVPFAEEHIINIRDKSPEPILLIVYSMDWVDDENAHPDFSKDDWFVLYQARWYRLVSSRSTGRVETHDIVNRTVPFVVLKKT